MSFLADCTPFVFVFVSHVDSNSFFFFSLSLLLGILSLSLFLPEGSSGDDESSGYEESCNGTTTVANDWTHANSVSVSALDGSLIVSIRHLSTVCSFAPPPALGGINWCVSSELPGRSNFSFADEADMFFNQHAALQLANGNLVLFDNGNARVEEGWGGGRRGPSGASSTWLRRSPTRASATTTPPRGGATRLCGRRCR